MLDPEKEMIQNKKFNILDYIERLQPTKRRNRYVCPVCSGNDLTVDPKTGKYQCWHGCECRDIRDSISPIDQGINSSYYKTDYSIRKASTQVASSKPHNQPKKCDVTQDKKVFEDVHICRFDEPPSDHPERNLTPFINGRSVPRGVPPQAIEIKYSYSEHHSVSRFEWQSEDNTKGHEKTIRMGHYLPDGSFCWKKGENKWLPYRIDEAISLGAGKWILGTEGEQCVEIARSIGVVAITWQGGSWTREEIIEGLLKLKDAGILGLVYWPDHDRPGYKKAESIVDAALSIGFPVLVLDPLAIWPLIPDKGDIADWVVWGQGQNMKNEDFISRLEAAIHSAVESRNEERYETQEKTSEPNSLKPPKPDVIGANIAEKYFDKWIYCDEIKSWMEYEYSTPGVWSVVSELYISAQIHHILKANFISGYGESYLKSITGILKRELFTASWESDPNLLPFSDRVLELDTGKTREHHPSNRLTWVLPRPYISPQTSWDTIDRWLTEATRGNESHKKTLLCFAAAVLRRRYDLQKFLHLIGTGGSGKSTFMNLLIALIGEGNTVSIDLESLNERDALAELFGKVLAVFPDQDSAGKKLSNFKKVTGGDLLRGRRLYQDGFNFRFPGMTIMSSNSPIFHGSTAKWLARRAIMIPFDLSVPAGKTRNLDREFEPELSALTNYLLSIPLEEIEAVLKGSPGGTTTINPTLWTAQIRSDGLASWLNDWVILDPTGRVQVGSDANEWREGGYNPITSTLFGSYCLHCRQSNRSPLTKDNFSANLLELLGTLNWRVEKIRTNTGRFVKGIRLRTPNDNEILPLDEMLSEDLKSDGTGVGVSDGFRDDLNPLPDKESVEGDDLNTNLLSATKNLEQTVETTAPESTEIPKEDLMASDSDSPTKIDKEYKEVVDFADTPTQTETGSGFEVVTEAVTEVVTTADTPIYREVISIPENPRILIELSTSQPLIFLRHDSIGFYLVMDDNGAVRKVSKLDCCDINDLEEIPSDGEIIDEIMSSYLIRTPDGQQVWVSKKGWNERI